MLYRFDVTLADLPCWPESQYASGTEYVRSTDCLVRAAIKPREFMKAQYRVWLWFGKPAIAYPACYGISPSSFANFTEKCAQDGDINTLSHQCEQQYTQRHKTSPRYAHLYKLSLPEQQVKGPKWWGCGVSLPTVITGMER